MAAPGESRDDDENDENKMFLEEESGKLRRSLDQAKAHKLRVDELSKQRTADKQENVDAKTNTEPMQIIKLLNKVEKELTEKRQRLSSVLQERLTVAEQLTAATQQRERQESGNSEQLQLQLTPQHQPTTLAGDRSGFLLTATNFVSINATT